MIVWLSSYPRSGNTLLRLMLKRVWGASSYSVYDDRADIGADDEVRDAVGHRFLPAPWPVAYEQMKSAAETFFVKTHDIPIDSGKCIYVVRDGRSASRSFSHYLNDFARRNNEQTVSLAEVILGVTPFGSWSNHLDGWEPQSRPDTLLLKYEDLIATPEAQIEHIGEFLGMPPVEDWQNNFVELNQRNPKFFRSGAKNDPNVGMNEAEIELFWAMHGAWMQRLGYEQSDGTHQSGAMPLTSRHLIHAALCNLQGKVRAGEAPYLAEIQKTLVERDAASQELEATRRELESARQSINALTAEGQLLQERINLLTSHMQTLQNSRAIRVISALRLSPKVQMAESE